MHNFYLYSLLFLLWLSVLRVLAEQSFDVVWTDEEEKNILTEEEHKVAFRDVVLEGEIQMILTSQSVENDQLENILKSFIIWLWKHDIVLKIFSKDDWNKSIVVT